MTIDWDLHLFLGRLKKGSNIVLPPVSHGLPPRSRWHAVGGDLHFFLGVLEKSSNIVRPPDGNIIDWNLYVVPEALEKSSNFVTPPPRSQRLMAPPGKASSARWETTGLTPSVMPSTECVKKGYQLSRKAIAMKMGCLLSRGEGGKMLPQVLCNHPLEVSPKRGTKGCRHLSPGTR